RRSTLSLPTLSSNMPFRKDRTPWPKWPSAISTPGSASNRNLMRILIILAMASPCIFAQGRGGTGVRRPADSYPQRPPAPAAVVERGKALYGVNCNFCHGSDARGGEGGPNLLRSELVLNDRNGELITPVVRGGRGEMPKLDLTAEQISDIAAYIHSFKVAGYDAARMTPPSILAGDATAGEAYFKAKCASCHSVIGDLKGIASKYSEPRTLQNTWVSGGGGGGRGGRGGGENAKPSTVTVTLAGGRKLDGILVRKDDFLVT